MALYFYVLNPVEDFFWNDFKIMNFKQRLELIQIPFQSVISLRDHFKPKYIIKIVDKFYFLMYDTPPSIKTLQIIFRFKTHIVKRFAELTIWPRPDNLFSLFDPFLSFSINLPYLSFDRFLNYWLSTCFQLPIFDFEVVPYCFCVYLN